MKYAPLISALRVGGVVLLAGWGGLAMAATSAPRPNIIVILADDLGYADVACYGGTRHRTPHIDALAREGLRLTDFHANGSVCSPTRAAMLTGRYQQRAGIDTVYGEKPGEGLAPGLPTLPGLLRTAGYVTAMFGKWHLGMTPPFTPVDHGFDEFIGLLTGDGDHRSRVSRAGHSDWWRGPEPFEESGYTTDLITQHSLDFIERHRTQPFFLYVAHLAVHFPWQGPRDPADRKDGGGSYEGLPKFGSRADKHAAFHEMVEALDGSVGQIIAKLRELKLDENTLVVFASDNGGYAIDRGGYAAVSDHSPWRGQKSQNYEGGHRVPGIFWWPGHIAAGRESAATAMTMDLLPTFLPLAGVPLPKGAEASDGMDLKPLLFADQGLPDRMLFWRKGTGKAARQGQWKLIVDRPGIELYNLADDPGEKHDLAAAHPEQVKLMIEALASWEKEVDASAQTLTHRSAE